MAFADEWCSCSMQNQCFTGNPLNCACAGDCSSLSRPPDGCTGHKDYGPTYPTIGDMLAHFDPRQLRGGGCAQDIDEDTPLDKNYCQYNEVVLNARKFEHALPDAVSAFFYMRNCFSSKGRRERMLLSRWRFARCWHSLICRWRVRAEQRQLFLNEDLPASEEDARAQYNKFMRENPQSKAIFVAFDCMLHKFAPASATAPTSPASAAAPVPQYVQDLNDVFGSEGVFVKQFDGSSSAAGTPWLPRSTNYVSGSVVAAAFPYFKSSLVGGAVISNDFFLRDNSPINCACPTDCGAGGRRPNTGCTDAHHEGGLVGLEHMLAALDPAPNDDCGEWTGKGKANETRFDRMLCQYNEVVLDGAKYATSLPKSVLAFFYMQNCFSTPGKGRAWVGWLPSWLVGGWVLAAELS